jgi:FlaA1/EpsC-like NDP-sugar epimerase
MAEDKAPVALKPPTRRQLIFLSWTKDVLIYIIVLNLFVEYNPKIIIDSFTISIFTAILLKILLEIILKIEHKVSDVFKEYKVLRILLVWIILFGSKFLILEVVDLVFGEHVELGKFLDVIVLVIALIVAREIFQRIYLALGERETKKHDEKKRD